MKSWAILFLSAAGISIWAGPVLKIAPGSFGFGKYPANQSKEHEFTVSNTGDELLVIEKVKVTCGCSAADIARKKLAPGESTTLTARINKESISGPFSKAIFIHSNAANGRIQMLTVSGEAVPLVTVTPQNKLYLGTLTVGKQIQQEFLLTAGSPVEYAQPEISGDIEPQVKVETLPENKLLVKLTWTPEKEIQIFNSKITITIKSPEDWNPVEISLQGQVKK